MTRRSVLALAALPLGAQIRYREYGRCLPEHLSALAAEAYARRNRRVAALTNAAAIREYQSWARATFLRLAGPLPGRAPLNLRTTGKLERRGYTIEKVVYE